MAMPLIGLQIIEQTLAVKRSFGTRSPLLLHYHPRSDHHSIVACFAMTVDLLSRSEALRRDVANQRLVLGINEQLTDHSTGRKKNLDLVIGTPSDVGAPRGKAKTLLEIVVQSGITLTDQHAALLETLPALPTGPIGQVRIATEAKAAMTEHSKARPRLYDELTSSHATVHGCHRGALALGFAMVNVAPRFLSPTRNENKNLGPGDVAVMNEHIQPQAAHGILEKLSELPVRGQVLDAPGFDGLAIVLVDSDNATNGFRLTDQVIDKRIQDRYRYDLVIDRVAGEYDRIYGSLS